MKGKRHLRASTMMILAAFFCTLCNAQTVTYRFEAPQLVLGQSTPLFNIVPDVGPSSFLASFTAPTGGSFRIDNFRANPSFAGQNLLDPAYPGATLRVTLNTPITDVQLDFE